MKTGNLINYVMDNSVTTYPEVGMGATILYWTDRSACTIMRVSDNKKRLWVSVDKANRIDKNDIQSESQIYSYETINKDNPVTWLIFSLRKNGKYYKQGQSTKNGLSLLIGYRDEYYDYSF